jgi:hypothetical protein
MANWEVRSKYLLHEIIKYQNYCDALEKSIKQQEKVKEEEDVNCRLVYKENDVDLFKEINQELRLNF